VAAKVLAKTVGTLLHSVATKAPLDGIRLLSQAHLELLVAPVYEASEWHVVKQELLLGLGWIHPN
jgi:hypothetical protein